MRDLLQNVAPENPMEAARRATRPVLRRRFYERASIVAADQGFAVELDGKPIRTPAGRILGAPSEPVAAAIAAEWDAQRDLVDPATMPLTRLANSIIDGVGDNAAAVAAEIARYLASDLVYYRAASPQGLVALQTRHWDPVVAWARNALGARFALAEGIMHVAQPDAALAAATAAIPPDPWRLGALHTVTTLTGSALIALALAHGALTPDAAWEAAHVDEDWNIAQWGEDQLAQERRAFRLAEFQAAAAVLRLV
jgi:chaperone required for assembly of F1-ATPase